MVNSFYFIIFFSSKRYKPGGGEAFRKVLNLQPARESVCICYIDLAS